MIERPLHLYSGLALIALATLVLEVVLTRLLSVITWYYLAFLAISLAMLGLTAGAVYLYLSARRVELPALLARHTLLFALSAAASHLLLLALPVPTAVDPSRSGGGLVALLGLLGIAAVIAVPFFFAGVAIAAALTRTTLPVGRVYAADLLGAGLGCLLAIPLLDHLDPTSAVFALAAVAALGAVAFSATGKSPARRGLLPAGLLGKAALATAALLALAAVTNHALYPRLWRVETMKGRPLGTHLAVDRWNSHSRVTARAPRRLPPVYWGAVPPPPEVLVEQMPLRIDGGAFTVATRFAGDPAELGWIARDVTTLAYHLAPAEVAVIGVGGGRDLLAALAFGSRRVTGIEINRILLDLLGGELRAFTGLADHPAVRLVHGEGRSTLARGGERYDLVQMALVDTWAATAAGAMTLSENGLYTVEAWRTLLDRLTPEGALTVSRWYAPDRPGETARLASLGVASLLAEQAADPARHLVLASAGRLATLIVKRTPLSAGEIAALEQAGERYGFAFLARPGVPPEDELLRAVIAARSTAELAAATAHPILDLAPPHDDRPFFFNMLKASRWLDADAPEAAGGVLAGNLRATDTLITILIAVVLLAAAAIGGPLAVLGRRHGLSAGRFSAAAAYFSLIGLGFMLVEIALLQRFSLLLGHPVYSLAITLMSLIVATGLGSLASDALALTERRAVVLGPLAVAAAVALVAVAVGPAIRAATGAPFAGRVAAVVATTVPLGLLLGLPFPLGLRLLRRRSPVATSWMWGINGAFGVVGSVLAVMVSMAFGISRCLALGALCYLLLAVPALLLFTAGDDTGAGFVAGK